MGKECARRRVDSGVHVWIGMVWVVAILARMDSSELGGQQGPLGRGGDAAGQRCQHRGSKQGRVQRWRACMIDGFGCSVQSEQSCVRRACGWVVLVYGNSRRLRVCGDGAGARGGQGLAGVLTVVCTCGSEWCVLWRC